MSDFVDRRSIVRTIWCNTDLVLLIFAGAAAEFALNRAVDWLFFTGQIPRDPIGRLFSTVRYAQQIVCGTEETAGCTLARINAKHSSVERQRGQNIPDWAYRDVLYMLIDYSERSYRLFKQPLSVSQQQDLYEVFKRIGEGLSIPDLPESYEDWRADRRQHMVRDLRYSRHTSLLFRQYRRHLGLWRYFLLLEVQALLVPDEVRRMLRLRSNKLISGLARTYGIISTRDLQSIVHGVLVPPRYWRELVSMKSAAMSGPGAVATGPIG